MSDQRLPAGPPATTLRVYEPLEAFPEPERAAWDAWLPTAPTHDDVAAHERAAAWRHVVHPRHLTGSEPEPRMARVLEAGDSCVICPVQLPLRFAAAARDAVRTLPAVVSAAVAGAASAADAGHGREDGGADDDAAGAGPAGAGPDLRLRTLVAVWDIPWAWLALVRPGDRRPGGDPAQNPYVLPMSAARSRAARALRVLRGSGADEDLGEEVESVARWLEDFHPRALVEVDDAAVARLLGDDGAEDVRLGLEALEAGEVTAVAAAYRRLASRGDRMRLLSRAS